MFSLLIALLITSMFTVAVMAAEKLFDMVVSPVVTTEKHQEAVKPVVKTVVVKPAVKQKATVKREAVASPVVRTKQPVSYINSLFGTDTICFSGI